LEQLVRHPTTTTPIQNATEYFTAPLPPLRDHLQAILCITGTSVDRVPHSSRSKPRISVGNWLEGRSDGNLVRRRGTHHSADPAVPAIARLQEDRHQRRKTIWDTGSRSSPLLRHRIANANVTVYTSLNSPSGPNCPRVNRGDRSSRPDARDDVLGARWRGKALRGVAAILGVLRPPRIERKSLPSMS
jgi:hypothetical protein